MVIKKQDLSIIGITIDNFYELLNEYSSLVGTKQNIKQEITKLKKIHKNISKYVLSMSQDDKLDYTLAIHDLEQLDKNHEEEPESITPTISKVYGYIDKKTINVIDYTQHYIQLRDGKFSV